MEDSSRSKSLFPLRKKIPPQYVLFILLSAFLMGILIYTTFPVVFALASNPVEPPSTLSVGGGTQDLQVPAPPFSEGIFPCSQCHRDLPVNRTRRELQSAHDDIVLKHGPPENRWCLDCHHPDNRDSLRLANGEAIDFRHSYTLCGQCHGDKFRDWRAGIHGKRTGDWNGKKQYLLCVHCHNPHSPHFKPIAPLPPPLPPQTAKELKGAKP